VAIIIRAFCWILATVTAINGCTYRPAEGLVLGGLGSGIAVSAMGHRVTNNHVIADCEAISATTTSGFEAKARVLRSDSVRDLALLIMEGASLRPATFPLPKTNLSGGELSGNIVRFLGYPNGGGRSLRPVIRPGRILQLTRGPLPVPVIVFKGKVDPGNSGGPLLTSTGQVVGLVFAKASVPAVYRDTGEESAIRMSHTGLALPFWEIMLFLEDANISYESSIGGRTATTPDHFLVRINCWKEAR
jgi:S1-C subfamily serine protease